MSQAKQLMKVGALVIIIVVMAMAVNSHINDDSEVGLNAVTGNVVNTGSTGEIQKVVLKMVDYGYVLEPSTLNKDIPVLLEGDMNTLYGCMKDIRIPAFGVNKLLSKGDNTVQFTPTKTGEFRIACSMNMGQGTFTVVESDGTKSDYIETVDETELKGSSCGSASGCGCSG